MTELKIISAVMNSVTAFEGVTNLSLDSEQVGDELDTLRVRMIGEMDKVSLFRRPYGGFVQIIESVATVKADNPDDPKNKKIAYVDLPRMVMTRSNYPSYNYIGGRDRRSPYRVITGDQYLNALHDQFIGKMPIAHYSSSGRITFYNTTPSFVRIEAVFEDPSALEILGAYDAETSDYPMPSGMIDQLMGKTVESYGRQLYRIRPQPNTQSDIPQASEMKTPK